MRYVFIILTSVLFGFTGTYAQNSEYVEGSTGDVNFELFGSTDILSVTLKSDFTSLMKDKSTEDYLPAELVYYLDSGDSLVNRVRIRARGNSRLDFCAFPPYRINFSECENPPVDLQGISNLKIISHCMTTKKYQEYLLREYLSYKLYNVVTDTSFRVRLLSINYIDTGNRGFNRQLLGVALEPLDLLSTRLNVVEREDIVVRSTFIDPVLLDRLCMFQYLIGNEDWFIPNLHNLKLIEPVEGDSQIMGIVPYDFDYAGIVNAYYAVPSPAYGLETIQERIYAGACRSEDEFRELAKLFLDFKDEFYREVEALDLLSSKARRHVLSYLESFYRMYKRDYIIYSMKKTCAK